ncbi:hypothetical protein [Pseudoalteromonas ruthenica]|uniref:hypothetical protein n=1 Tax=Pseudoalteromonas ruthenica TaxID=151081 RepID=UPI00110B46CC|nr:hypothetical protein [Pseudoalteromonas ruthenica]TMO87649.1 hypothetical protein CWC12_10235 [Pseudoalteromonas ruthenica]TMP22274.1 hypothetical protein CWC06_15775 [Pseudoalteromonas ruthenica]
MNVKTKKLTTANLLPPPADKCQQCGVKHDSDQPHNRDSMFYQVRFKLEHERNPTWSDAIAHCSPAVIEQWVKALREHGVNFDTHPEPISEPCFRPVERKKPLIAFVDEASKAVGNLNPILEGCLR